MRRGRFGHGNEMFLLVVDYQTMPCTWKTRNSGKCIWKLGFLHSNMIFIPSKFDSTNFFSENAIAYTKMISKQQATWIHHWFSLKHHKTQESSTNKFHHQTSKQHNFRNKQPFSKTKASWSSAWIDLSKACIYFKKQGGRNFTKMEEQSRYRCCLVALTQNRCALSF